MDREITRRSALGLISSAVSSLAAAVKTKEQPPLPSVGEFVRFSDPTTETPVVRLTTPAYQHILPASGNRFVLLKPRVLYCSSDRAGARFTPFQVDLRTGMLRQTAETAALDPLSLAVDGQGRFLYFLDGSSVCRLPVNAKREVRKAEVIADGVTSFTVGASEAELFVVRKGTLQSIKAKDNIDLAQDVNGRLLVRPGGAGILFTRPRGPGGGEQEFWYAAALAAGSRRPVLLAQGRIASPHWSEDGTSLLFLRNVPKENVFVAEVHEVAPETPNERCISPTSQFAVFAPNMDDSVLVGASNSKAQPNVVLLLRSLKRELTLCEHRSSSAADVRPSFSPDSRRVYFSSDREGKSAIYSVNVEHLIEPT